MRCASARQTGARHALRDDTRMRGSAPADNADRETPSAPCPDVHATTRATSFRDKRKSVFRRTRRPSPRYTAAFARCPRSTRPRKTMRTLLMRLFIAAVTPRAGVARRSRVWRVPPTRQPDTLTLIFRRHYAIFIVLRRPVDGAMPCCPLPRVRRPMRKQQADMLRHAVRRQMPGKRYSMPPLFVQMLPTSRHAMPTLFFADHSDARCC